MAKADPTAQVLEQYDPGAGEFDPELDARPEPKKQAPQKDPETGRFLPNKAKHPASLVTRAKGLGLSDEEIGQYETADLRSEISQLQNERLIERTNASIQRAIDSPEPENPRPQVMPREEAPPVDDAFDLGVPADKYSEDLISDLSRALTKLRNDLRAEFKESLEKEVGPVRQFQSHQQATAVLNKLDKKFAAKPEIYGAGATEDLAPESPERFRREAVLGQMSGLLKSKRATTPEKDWEKIDSLLYPGKPKPHVEEQPVERNGHQPRFTQDQWDESASPMPTHRKPAAEPHGDRRAVKAVAAKLREQNQSNGYGDEEQDLE